VSKQAYDQTQLRYLHTVIQQMQVLHRNAYRAATLEGLEHSENRLTFALAAQQKHRLGRELEESISKRQREKLRCGTKHNKMYLAQAHLKFGQTVRVGGLFETQQPIAGGALRIQIR
jgi:hypothetical protein